MIAFRVNDMSCGHCVDAITRAVRAVDADAVVTADLAQHRVGIESTRAGSADFAAALTAAGYTPQAVPGPG